MPTRPIQLAVCSEHEAASAGREGVEPLLVKLSLASTRSSASSCRALTQFSNGKVIKATIPSWERTERRCAFIKKKIHPSAFLFLFTITGILQCRLESSINKCCNTPFERQSINTNVLATMCKRVELFSWAADRRRPLARNICRAHEDEFKLWNFSRKLRTRLLSDNLRDFVAQSEAVWRRSRSSLSLL